MARRSMLGADCCVAHRRDNLLGRGRPDRACRSRQSCGRRNSGAAVFMATNCRRGRDRSAAGAADDRTMVSAQLLQAILSRTRVYGRRRTLPATIRRLGHGFGRGGNRRRRSHIGAAHDAQPSQHAPPCNRRRFGPNLYIVLRGHGLVDGGRHRPRTNVGRRKRRVHLSGATMTIVVQLDIMLAQRKVKSKDLAEHVGITEANMSLLKQAKVKGIRFDTLEKICDFLDCQPGDLLVY